MNVSIREGSGALRWLPFVLAGAFALGCATEAAVREPVEQAAPEMRLTDVTVEPGEGTTRVSLHGLADARYRVESDPVSRMLSLHLENVRPDFLLGRLEVRDGIIESVAFELDPDARATEVIVTLAGDYDFDVVPEADSNRLDLNVMRVEETDLAAEGSGRGVEPEEVAAWNAPAAPLQTPSPAPSGAERESSQEETTPTLAAAGPPASRLLAVDVEEAEAETRVHLRGNGAIAGVETFTLDDPDRLVIDLPGLVNTIPTSQITLGLTRAEALRIGQHDDKVRVVIDGNESPGAFANRDVRATERGALVRFGPELVGAAEIPLPDEAGGRSEIVAEPPVVTEAASAGSEWQPDLDPLGVDEIEPEAGGAGEPEVEVPGFAEPVTLPEELARPVVSPVEKAPAREAIAPAQADEPSEATSSAPGAQPARAEIPANPGDSEGIELARQPGIEVEEVRLDPGTVRERVVIRTDQRSGRLDFRTHEPDDETLVVSVRGARIDPEAAVRLIPPPGGSVSLVSAFQQPDVQVPEVRVVVTRAVGVEPRIAQSGSELHLDFATGLVANLPPVVQEPAPTTAAADAAPSGEATAPVPAAATAASEAAAPAAIDPAAPVDILEEGGFAEGKEYIGRRISLDFKDAEIDDVLRLIAEVSDLNVIAGDEVQGRVTIRLVEVPWDQALDVILMTQGLGFERVGNVLRIAPSDLIKAEREARLQERRALEKLEDLVVKLQPVNYANVKEVKDLVSRLLTPRGSVNTDQRTSTVIMKDIPSVIDEATALIKAIDTQTPQVMIEAKIVEAQLDFSRELGSEWGFGSQPDEDFDDFTTGDTQPITATSRATFPFTDANNVVVRNPITSAATGLLNLGHFLLDGRLSVRLRLAAAEARGEGKVISSPRVVTLDNREAVIEQGISIPFQTFENGDAALEFIDAVLQLKVTPHITADKSIIMDIKVTRNAPDSSIPTPTGSPAIAKNEAKTEALVRDGQTLVIGGIYVIDKSDSESRVPYLHKIPGLGNAFRNKAISDTRNELLIFVTPRIVQSQQAAS